MELPATSIAIASLSPSRLEDLRCPARVSFNQAAHGSGSQAPAGAAGMGEAVHRAMELAVKDGVAPELAWQQSCDQMRAKGFDPMAQPNGRRMRSRFIRTLDLVLDVVKSFGPARKMCEETIYSLDGSLEGTPDLVLVNDSRFVVIDYKSGFVLSDGEALPKYTLQLRLYAHLIAETQGLVDGTAMLVSLRDGAVEIDVAPDQRAAAADLARAQRLAYNERAPGPQPAAPSEEHCSYCKHMPRCEAFWQAVDPAWKASMGHAIEGSLVMTPEVSKAGLAAVMVNVSRGTTVEETVTIGDLPAERLLDAAVGSTIAVCHIREKRDTAGIYLATDRTLVGVPTAR